MQASSAPTKGASAPATALCSTVWALSGRHPATSARKSRATTTNLGTHGQAKSRLASVCQVCEVHSRFSSAGFFWKITHSNDLKNTSPRHHFLCAVYHKMWAVQCVPGGGGAAIVSSGALDFLRNRRNKPFLGYFSSVTRETHVIDFF